MNKFAIIVAGGSGSRMGSDLPKQFLLLRDKPVLMHTLEAFAEAEPDAEIIVVLPESQQLYWQELCTQHRLKVRHDLATGGSTRMASVRNGLGMIMAADGVVAIHDGVRPLVPAEVIRKSYATAAETGSAVAAVPVKDSVRELLWGAEGASRAIDRVRLRLVQTPQTFRLPLIREAFEKAESEEFTDDASVLESAGQTVHLIEGSYRNIKITTPEDLVMAEGLMK